MFIQTKYPSLIFCKIEARFERERERERESWGLRHTYHDIISVENLLISWQEFLRGKRKRRDVITFTLNFMDNVLALHQDLKNKTYSHGSYYPFKINDPKPRDIHKAQVRDRLVHHALHRLLYPYFDRQFIHDSYSCRLKRGTHRAMNRLRMMARRTSRNHTRTVWILKCDIRKFFANIDHAVLKKILARHIPDSDILWLLHQVIDSFHSENGSAVGLPLGNLTSQLLVNVYMNEFDQFVKRKLKVKYYLRYADDFIVLHGNQSYLVDLVPKFAAFLESDLHLSLHPKKLFIKTLTSGMDFLGWIHFPHHRVPRTSTKRRMRKKLSKNPSSQTIASYVGLLGHGNTHKLQQKILSDLASRGRNQTGPEGQRA
jgi:retron-type reverse transcriptase